MKTLYNPLLWSVPLGVGFVVLGAAILNASNTARQYLPEVTAARLSVDAAAQKLTDATNKLNGIVQNAPQTAEESGKAAGKGMVEGAAKAVLLPQTIITDKLPPVVQAVVDPVGAVARALHF